MICSLLRCRCFRGRPHYQRVDDGSSGISFPFALISRPFSLRWAISLLFRLTVAISGLVMSFSLYHRTTNLWTLKNLGDTWMVKHIGRRPIVLGAFHRPSEEQNVPGHFAVLQFLGDGRQSHSLFCLSESADGQRKLLTRAHIERIHKGKRAANDLCSWSGHLAECEIVDEQVRTLRLTTEPNLLALPAPTEHSIEVRLEQPLRLEGRRKLPLAVCVAPMYTYTDWQIMLMGIETWMALGAQKMVFPIQSASSDTVFILREYERIGIVHIRMWPKWPLLSDVNPNGLTLSRGIEESHVNCLHFVKPFVDFAVFTDIDDMLMPLDPMKISPGINVAILQGLAQEHPNAGSFLFEHRDVQFAVPEMAPEAKKMLASFNFDFLRQTQWKTKCKVWRMKTRVVVNASRVDSVNMHETGIHRFGYVQVRVPCRVAHFYHLRHSYRNMALNEWPIDMANLRQTLNGQWANRLRANFSELAAQKPLAQSSVESFADFDHCMSAINEEHWGLRVSRCLTPHVCFSRLAKNISCMAASGNYQFVHSSGDFVIALSGEASFGDSEQNCEAPLPKFVAGNHFYMP